MCQLFIDLDADRARNHSFAPATSRPKQTIHQAKEQLGGGGVATGRLTLVDRCNNLMSQRAGTSKLANQGINQRGKSERLACSLDVLQQSLNELSPFGVSMSQTTFLTFQRLARAALTTTAGEFDGGF